MPHKRAKKSARDLSKKQQGNDLVPIKQSLSDEPIPKSAARILNAAKIQQAYNDRKRKGEDASQPRGKRRKIDEGTRNGAQALTIKDGESIQHFYRRVEDDMRPLVKSAVQTGNAIARGAKKQQIPSKGSGKDKKFRADVSLDDEEDAPSTSTKHSSTKPLQAQRTEVKDFVKHSSSAPRRLNDIVQAPPELKKLPRGAAKITANKPGKAEGILSMAQRQMMEVERERAIARYRELKESRWKEHSEKVPATG